MDAMQERMKKCQEWNVEINRRTRKKDGGNDKAYFLT